LSEIAVYTAHGTPMRIISRYMGRFLMKVRTRAVTL